MAIKVQASRFAVLRVEDDDDSDEKGTKSKQPTSKVGQQSAEQKKKTRKKKPGQIKSDAELPNATSKKGSKKSGSHSGLKSDGIADSQWEQWLQKNDESADKEFEKQLSDALMQSKLDYEEKQKVEAEKSSADQNEGKTKKKNKKQSVAEAAVPSEALDQRIHGSFVVSQSDNHSIKVGKTEKSSKQNKPQTDLPKQQKAPVTDYKAAILEREEQIIELREHNRKLEAEVAEFKKKNQQFCLMLGRGEMLDLSSIKAELEEQRQMRDGLTREVACCLSELEKERSKSHALKAERDKLKGIKHVGK